MLFWGMHASLRWVLALLAVAALGFAAGRFYDRDEIERVKVLTVRNAAPVGAGSAQSPEASIQALPQVPGALAEIMRLRGDFAQTTALYVLASSQDRAGLERLLNEAASIRQASERRAASSILYQRYAELDPEAAVAHMMAREADFDPTWLYGVFHTWARQDLAGAVAHSKTLDQRSRAMGGAAILRSRDDLPQADREALAAQLDVQVVQQESSAIDLRTPEAAQRSWRAALATENRESRTMKLHSLVQEWTMEDPQAAMRAIESLEDPQLRNELLYVGMHGWAEKEPRQAVNWVLARPRSQVRMQLLITGFSSFAAKEPTAAMDMAEELSSAERQQVLPSMFANWASIDARSAAARAERVEDAGLRSQVLSSVAMNWATNQPDEALRWAATLPDADSQPVMNMVVTQIASSDPARASVLVSQLSSGPERENTISNIVQSWAQWDPQAALTWISRLPASEVGPSAYSSLFAQWAMHDVDTAVGLASQLSDADNRNAALTGVLSSPYLDAAVAERLYRRIEGDDARRQAAMHLYYRFHESDREVAERYRKEAGMSEVPGQIVVQ